MKVYILEQYTYDYGDSHSDILGVYSSLENAREFIDNAGYRYEDSFFSNAQRILRDVFKSRR